MRRRMAERGDSHQAARDMTLDKRKLLADITEGLLRDGDPYFRVIGCVGWGSAERDP